MQIITSKDFNIKPYHFVYQFGYIVFVLKNKVLIKIDEFATLVSSAKVKVNLALYLEKTASLILLR